MRRSLRKNCEGNVFIIVALASLAIFGSAGLAIDIGRSQMVQAKLQNSVDAAGLAAGATLNAPDLESIVSKYITLNFNQGNLGATLGEIHTELSEDGKTFNVSASATLPTTIMNIFGEESVAVSAATEVTRSNKGLEVVLVLDTTGSMGNPSSKLASLKSASYELINILFGDETTSENLWIGIVPFSQAVNIGPSRTNWLDAAHYTGLNWATTSWAGCVDARYQAPGRDVTDDPPFDLALPGAATPAAPYERFKAYYWPDDSNNNWSSTTTDSDTDTIKICSKKSSCTCANYGPCTTTTVENTSTTIRCSGSGSSKNCYKDVTVTTTTTSYTLTSTKGPNAYCPPPITPLTNTKATVNAGIAALAARGNTHVNLGAVWGWRLVSPRWRGYWGGTMDTNNLPLDYDAPLMSKAVIIMTDGENTMSDSVRSAYGYLGQGNLGTTSSSTAKTKLNDKLAAVCTAMKAKGIVVYTVLFAEDSTTAANLMKNCATSPDYYFNSPTEVDLQAAFHAIGDSLANLRISK